MNKDTVHLIINKGQTIMIPLEGSMIFEVPVNPNPKRPTLAHHNYGEERMEWIKNNWDKGILVREASDE
mgnify:CR=1 FL=1